MNPPTPNKAVRIGPDSQPVFPCWLWCPQENAWAHANHTQAEIAERFTARWWPFTHYHPDQETAPTFAPEEKPCHVCGEPESKPGSSVCSATHGQHAPSVPAVEGVREVIERVVIGFSDTETEIENGPRELDPFEQMQVNEILSALTPYLAPAQRTNNFDLAERIAGVLLNEPDKNNLDNRVAFAAVVDRVLPVLSSHPTGKQAEGVRDTQMLDFLQQYMTGSGYPIQLKSGRDEEGARQNHVELTVGIGSGPWQKSFRSPPGGITLRSCLAHAMKLEGQAALRSSSQTGEGRG